MGRIDKPEPIVILLAPVVRQGEYSGYINSVLKLERIKNNLDIFSGSDGLLYSLLDVKGKVILSNRPDQTMMNDFKRGKGSLHAVDDHVMQWIPELGPNTSASERWQKSYYVTESTVSELGGWKLILEQPLAPFQKILYENYAFNLSVLLAILIFTLALAEILSRRTVDSLRKLSKLTRGIPEKLQFGKVEVSMPFSNIKEVHQLVDNFGSMARLVVQQFNEIKISNDLLELRVIERTAELTQSELRFRTFFENNCLIMLLIDPLSLQIKEANQTAINYYGFTREELTEKPISELNNFLVDTIAVNRKSATEMNAKSYQTKHRLASGTLRDVEVYPTEISIAGRGSLFITIHDVTERENARQALADSEAKHRALIENSHDIIYTLDAGGVFTFVSSSWTHLLGHEAHDVLDSTYEEFVHPDDLLVFKMAFQALFITGHRQTDIEYRIRHQNGTWSWHNSNASPLVDISGQTIGFQGNAKDITEHIEVEEKMRQLALYDELTQLPNRRLLTERLYQALAVCKRNRTYSALMFVDLDKFKTINDTHGHHTGDLLLVEVAKRLTGCVRGTDTVARFGGDEFVVMLSELNLDGNLALTEANGVAEKIRFSLSQPCFLTSPLNEESGVDLHCSASIGVIVFGDDGSSLEDIIKWADETMYFAKSAGRNQIHTSASRPLVALEL